MGLPFTVHEDADRLRVLIFMRRRTRAWNVFNAILWTLIAVVCGLMLWSFNWQLGASWWLWLLLSALGAASSIFTLGRSEQLDVTGSETELRVLHFGRPGKARTFAHKGRRFIATTKPRFFSATITEPMLTLTETRMRAGTGMLSYEEAANLRARIDEYLGPPA